MLTPCTKYEELDSLKKEKYITTTNNNKGKIMIET